MAYWLVVEREGSRSSSAHTGTFFRGFKTFEEAEEWRNLSDVPGKLPPDQYRIEPDEDEVAPEPEPVYRWLIVTNTGTFIFDEESEKRAAGVFERQPGWVNEGFYVEKVQVVGKFKPVVVPPTTLKYTLEEV